MNLLYEEGFNEVQHKVKHQSIVIGDVFSRLTVLLSLRKPKGRTKCLVQCDCGQQRLVFASSLIAKHTRSCGCLHKDTCTTHGLSNSVLHSKWRNMRDRCNNKKSKDYCYYGGQGIHVDDTWDTFEQFYYDVSGTYFEHAQLDRVDNELGYSKSNYQWLSALDHAAKTKAERLAKKRHCGLYT